MKLSELRPLMLLGLSRDILKKAIDSIDLDYITVDEFINFEYFEFDDLFYNSNEYVIDHFGDLRLTEECFYCEGYGDYFFSFDNASTILNEGYRSSKVVSMRYINESSDYYYLYENEHYDGEALSNHDLCWLEDLELVGRQDDNYYHENGGWYSYPSDDDDDDDLEDYVRGYHNGGYKLYTFDNVKKYRIGFEIEKEDRDVLTSMYINEFENKTDDYWRKERDGSLNDYTGYELISPTFEFDIPKIFKLIESNEVLVNHINAEYSTNCGGHIHLSERDSTGEELFDRIKGYTPLFYALYHGRVDRNYCKGKKNDSLKEDDEKYQAIKIHHDRVEFRIISAVPSVSTLKWRCKLLDTILKHPTDDPIKAYYNVDTKFTKLLGEVYKDERLSELKKRFIHYTKRFEDLDINN